MAKKGDNIDYRMLGDEPTPKHYSGIELIRALNWYSYYSDPSDVKWVLEFLNKGNFKKSDVASFKKLSDKEIPQSIRAISRIINNGGSLDPEMVERFRSNVISLIDKGRTIIDEVKTESDSKSPQDYLKDKIDEVISAVEFEIDSQITDFPDSEFSLYDYLNSIEAKSIYGKKVADYFQPKLDEVNEALNKNDKELTESYLKSFGNVRSLKKHQTFLQSIVDDAERFATNQKKTRVRKQRKTKTKSAMDLVKKVNYKKEDKGLKLVSTNPANVVGATSLWTFNTKTRQLTVYYASDGGTLTINGSTLKNFDEKTSESKKIRENYLEAMLPKVLDGGKVALRKLLGEVKAKPVSPNGRLNKDTVLVRAIK